jgi:microcystin degradation protein MlrC
MCTTTKEYVPPSCGTVTVVVGTETDAGLGEAVVAVGPRVVVVVELDEHAARTRELAMTADSAMTRLPSPRAGVRRSADRQAGRSFDPALIATPLPR